MHDFRSAFKWPLPDPEIEDLLSEAYSSGDWGRYDGPNQQILTDILCNYFNLKWARLCCSGTVAIEIALKAAGVGKDDEVALAAYEFPGNFRSIEAVDATPLLIDVEPDRWSMSVSSLQLSVSDKTKAVIVSHLHGDVADIEELVRFASGQDMVVIEDICQCPGAKIQSGKLGTFGDLAVLSFGGSKLLTAGRGGALLTNNEHYFQRAKIYCDRGNDAFPLSELQAAVLIPQLQKLDEQNSQRLQEFQMFHERIQKLPAIKTVNPPKHSKPAFYKLPILLPQGADRQNIIFNLQQHGLLIDQGFRGFANRSKNRCQKPQSCDNARSIAERTLVLHHPCLLSGQFPEIVKLIASALESECY